MTNTPQLTQSQLDALLTTVGEKCGEDVRLQLAGHIDYLARRLSVYEWGDDDEAVIDVYEEV